MQKPVKQALHGKFSSLDALARALAFAYPDLAWPATRALAVKIGDIDRGDTVWWRRRREHADALSDVLQAPLIDLGLHDSHAGKVIRFATFPELPPVSTAHDGLCEIGYAGDDAGKTLDFWLAVEAPHYALRCAESPLSWLTFQAGAGLDFFWSTLCARTRHPHVRCRRLLDIGALLRQSGNLLVLLEQPCDGLDLDTLADAHRDRNLLIIAPFAAPPQEPDAGRRMQRAYFPSWGALTDGSTMVSGAAFDGIRVHHWHLFNDWQDRLLKWVEAHLLQSTSDTLFSAAGVRNWLDTFPRDWNFVSGPADLLAVCRLCHLARETALPRMADPTAGQQLLRRVTGANQAVAERFTELVGARLASRAVGWRDAIRSEQWAGLVSMRTVMPDRVALMEIASGATAALRRERALALQHQLGDADTHPLLEAGLLIPTDTGAMMLTPQFLVDLLARDRLTRLIQDEPLERWAFFCHDEMRRALVDAALGSMPTTALLPVFDRICAADADKVAAASAGEALFWELGKRMCDGVDVAKIFAGLPERVFSARDQWTPTLWSRSHSGDTSHALVAVCWAWSLWCDAPFDVPQAWAWHFPGWAPTWVAVDFIDVLLPDDPSAEMIAPLTWRRLVAVATRLVRGLTHPPTHAPAILTPMLIADALRGRWPLDPSWVDTLFRLANYRADGWAQSLLLDAIEHDLALAGMLLPALMDRLARTEGGTAELVFFYRSPLRTWALKHLSFAAAMACLAAPQRELLWRYPHTLPPHLLARMLEHEAASTPSQLPAPQLMLRREAIGALDASQVDTITSLLGCPAFSEEAAMQLWSVAPEFAARLLERPERHAQSLRALVLHAPPAFDGAAARTILAQPGLLNDEEKTDWARLRLPTCGADAEMVARVMGWC